MAMLMESMRLTYYYLGPRYIISFDSKAKNDGSPPMATQGTPEQIPV